MKPRFSDVFKEDKYWLPFLNWILIIIISVVLATWFGGYGLGALTAIISSLVVTPMESFAPKSLIYLKDIYKEWSIFTHAGLFIFLIILLGVLIGFYRHLKGVWVWQLKNNGSN